MGDGQQADRRRAWQKCGQEVGEEDVGEEDIREQVGQEDIRPEIGEEDVGAEVAGEEEFDEEEFDAQARGKQAPGPGEASDEEVGRPAQFIEPLGGGEEGRAHARAQPAPWRLIP